VVDSRPGAVDDADAVGQRHGIDTMRQGTSPPLTGLPFVALTSLLCAQQPRAPAEIRYDRDVRPILADRCFKCHGPDAGARRADLRLDESEFATAAMKHGTPIAPGDPEKSEV